MKPNGILAVFLGCTIVLAQGHDMLIRSLAIENDLNDKDLMSQVQNPSVAAQSQYAHFVITKGRDHGFASTTHSSLEECKKRHEWNLGFDRIVYAHSSRGIATYRWNKISRQGSWNIIEGKNPLYSDDLSALAISITRSAHGVSFKIVTKQPVITDKVRNVAIDLVRSFTKEKTWIELRTDYFSWLGSCGFPGPQAQDLNISYIPGQVSEVTETCILGAGETECKWRTAPNRR